MTEQAGITAEPVAPEVDATVRVEAWNERNEAVTLGVVVVDARAAMLDLPAGSMRSMVEDPREWSECFAGLVPNSDGHLHAGPWTVSAVDAEQASAFIDHLMAGAGLPATGLGDLTDEAWTLAIAGNAALVGTLRAQRREEAVALATGAILQAVHGHGGEAGRMAMERARATLEAQAAHPTVTVCTLAVIRSGLMMVVRKRGEVQFIMPGGKSEEGETPEQAIEREITEELGCRVSAGSMEDAGTFTDRIANGAPGTVRVVVRTGRLDGTPVPCAEIEEIAWVGRSPVGRVPLAPSIENGIIPALLGRPFVPGPPMADAEVMALLAGETPLNRARREFSSATGRMEQAMAQRTPPGPVEMRAMEFDAVRRIAAELGVAT